MPLYVPVEISDTPLFALTPVDRARIYRPARCRQCPNHLRLYDSFFAGLCPQPAYAFTAYIFSSASPAASCSDTTHNSNQSQSDTTLSFAKMRNTMEANRKVWFITGKCAWGTADTAPAADTSSPGTSSGFGKRLVSTVLERGDYVIATVRNLKSFTLPVGDRTRLRIIVLDVCDTAENIQKTVDEALSIWGRIDVVVNNAGYGLKSLMEEGGYVTDRRSGPTRP